MSSGGDEVGITIPVNLDDNVTGRLPRIERYVSQSQKRINNNAERMREKAARVAERLFKRQEQFERQQERTEMRAAVRRYRIQKRDQDRLQREQQRERRRIWREFEVEARREARAHEKAVAESKRQYMRDMAAFDKGRQAWFKSAERERRMDMSASIKLFRQKRRQEKMLASERFRQQERQDRLTIRRINRQDRDSARIAAQAQRNQARAAMQQQRAIARMGTFQRGAYYAGQGVLGLMGRGGGGGGGGRGTAGAAPGGGGGGRGRFSALGSLARGAGGMAAGAVGAAGRAVGGVAGAVGGGVRGAMSIPGIMAGYMGGQIIGGAITGPLKLAADMEQARISFEVLLGSAGSAQKMLEDLFKFSEETPFRFPEVRQAAQDILRWGFSAEQVLPYLQSWGAAAASTPEGEENLHRIVRAMGQMRVRGRAMAEELNQLMDAGVDAYGALTEAYGINKQELLKWMENGVVPATLRGKKLEGAIDIITKKLETRFGPMLKRQQQSLRGLFNTIQDVFQVRILLRWGEGLANGIRPRLQELQKWLSANEKTMDAIGKAFEDLGFTVSDFVAGNVEGMVRSLGRVLDSPEFKNAKTSGERGTILWKAITDAIDKARTDLWNELKTHLPWLQKLEDFVNKMGELIMAANTMKDKIGELKDDAINQLAGMDKTLAEFKTGAIAALEAIPGKFAEELAKLPGMIWQEFFDTITGKGKGRGGNPATGGDQPGNDPRDPFAGLPGAGNSYDGRVGGGQPNYQPPANWWAPLSTAQESAINAGRMQLHNRWYRNGSRLESAMDACVRFVETLFGTSGIYADPQAFRRAMTEEGRFHTSGGLSGAAAGSVVVFNNPDSKDKLGNIIGHMALMTEKGSLLHAQGGMIKETMPGTPLYDFYAGHYQGWAYPNYGTMAKFEVPDIANAPGMAVQAFASQIAAHVGSPGNINTGPITVNVNESMSPEEQVDDMARQLATRINQARQNRPPVTRSSGSW